MLIISEMCRKLRVMYSSELIVSSVTWYDVADGESH
jgi:hypothetical protein